METSRNSIASFNFSEIEVGRDNLSALQVCLQNKMSALSAQ